MSRSTCLLVTAFSAVLPLTGQWFNLPTPSVPRTPDGKPNLTAPAPRAADGKPDFSGIWELDHAPCPAQLCADYVGGPEFLNMGAKLPGGLPYLPWAAELVRQRSADLGRDDPVAFCRPAGALRLLTFPPPRKVIQIPTELIVLSERDVTFRQIFTDGRALPEDPDPSFNGYSVGKWEGDSLVVQTIGFRDGIWLDRRGSPLSEGAKITERFRRVNFGTLTVEVTVDDPKTYSRAWTVTLTERIVLNTELLEYHCMDNEKDAKHAVGK